MSDDTVVTILQYGALAVGAIVFLTGWFRPPKRLLRENARLTRRLEEQTKELQRVLEVAKQTEVTLAKTAYALRKAEEERSVYRHRSGCRCSQCRAARLRFEREQRLLKRGFEQWTEETKRQHEAIRRNFFVPPPPGRRIPGLTATFIDPQDPPDHSPSFPEQLRRIIHGSSFSAEQIEIPKMGEVDVAMVDGGMVVRFPAAAVEPALPFADGHQAHEGEDAPPGQPPCLCGHSAGAHLDHREEWSICAYCDCLGYAAEKDESPSG